MIALLEATLYQGGSRPLGGKSIRRKTLNILLALYVILRHLALASAYRDYYYTSTLGQLERTYSTLSSSFDYSFNSSYADVAEFYPNCTGVISWIGDGDCDQDSTNNAECGYDGGDCCCCECSSSASDCFVGGFDCVNPHELGQTCLPGDPHTSLCSESAEYLAERYPDCVGNLAWIGDGDCDQNSTNNAECGYDGGDCCCCDCFSSDSECFVGGPACIDPSMLDQTCLPGNDTLISLCSEDYMYLEQKYPNCTGYLDWIGDGICDDENTNSAECDYDGGDCCCCECSFGDFECFVGGFDCIDPNVFNQTCLPNDNTSMSLCSEDYDYLYEKYPNCTGVVDWISDGICDEESTNNAECGYDGGDCCCCECPSSDSECFVGGLNCIDPRAHDQSCLPDDTRMLLCTESTYDVYPNCTGIIDWIGDGYCDRDNTNNAECGYDGGDCCFCQCLSSDSECFLGGSNCIDPYAVNRTCLPEDSTETTYYSGPFEDHAEQFPNCTGDIDWISDGQCDRDHNNNAECGYDGGDCCCCLCSSSDSECFVGGSACIDPHALDQSCLPDNSSYMSLCPEDEDIRAQFPDCQGPLGLIANGMCDDALNYEQCGYDGGDCCPCTCVSTSTHSCGSEGYYCIDPDAGRLENLCTPVPDYILPCSPSLPDRWHLSNSRDVESFAKSILCAGGTFEAEWHGSIALNKTIYISHGTVVRVIGDDALADGSRTSRVFTVVNASLHVSGMTFANGWAPVGGAVAAVRSNVSLEQTEFRLNTAKYGGALFASNGSSVFLRDGSLFTDNSADWSGGAVFFTDGVNFSSVGRTQFVSNSAEHFGGAMHIRSTSSVSWNGEIVFKGNVAGYGGAVSLWETEEMASRGNATFVGNIADRGDGGAIFIGSQCSVNLGSVVNFIANEAANDGGAVASSRGDSIYRTGSYSSQAITPSTGSYALVSGAAFFVGNKCRGSGGAISLLSGLTLAFETDALVIFRENSADVHGGAVHVLGLTVGPKFEGATFVANRAGENGGGASVAFSGDWMVGDKFAHPTTFLDCKFEENRATMNGGAISSSSGIDYIAHTSFIGNVAGTGGGLRLAGNLATVHGCSFTENSSDEGNGPAISHDGILLRIAESSFAGNFFQCPPGKFVDFNVDFNVTEGDSRYNEMCANCPDCLWASCHVLENHTLPMCRAVFEHTLSQGGTANLQDLVLKRSYWRATPSSREILRCYNPDACRGGLTSSPGFCGYQYEGPYCSVCKKGFTSRIQFQCERCEEKGSGIVLIALSSLIVALIVLMVAWYLIFGEKRGGKQGFMHRVVRHVPAQSVKIIIVAWQIITQFSSAANVTYPEVYQRFLYFVKLLNFELGWFLSAACILDVDFHYRFLTITIGPLVALALLGVTYSIAFFRNRHRQEELRHIRDKHITMVLWLTLLVYSSASSVVFGMFACDTLEDDEGYRERFLRTDYTINCDSPRHRALEILAGFMVIVYPVGIPCFYAIVLFRQRKLLQDGENRDKIPYLQSISTLWNAYTLQRFYYEVIECVRRMWLAGAVAFIYPNTAAQIAVTLVIAVVFAFLCEGLAPYSSTLDAWVSRTGHGTVFFSMYVALLAKVDVTQEKSESQEIFAGVLVGAHVCMIGAVVIEAVVLICWARIREDPGPRWLRVRPLSTSDFATTSISSTTRSLSASTRQDTRKKARNGSMPSLEVLSETS